MDKLNFIGNKIIKLNQQLLINIDVVQKVNLYDLDLVKLYYHYLLEILNDHSNANKYKSKIIELEHITHQFDEDNIFNLNYKELIRSEEYKYLVINCSPDKLGTIKNLSLSTSLLFGFSKEELIGRPLDYILPELYILPHKKLLINNIEKYKKNYIFKNTKNYSDSKIFETFVRNKMKYLVPIKMKNVLAYSEEGELLGISRIIADNYLISNKEQEIAYVLTDINFIINSFTPNSIKLLNLQLSSTNSNLDITKYISELKKDLYLYEEHDDSKKHKINGEYENKNQESFRKSILKIKTNLISKKYINNHNRKLINWNIFDIYGKTIDNARLSKLYITDLNDGFTHNNKGEDDDSYIENKLYKTSRSINTMGKIEKFSNKDLNPEKLNVDNSSIKTNRKLLKKFYLTVNEIKIGEIKVGYIFKFESFLKNNSPYYSMGSSNVSPHKMKKRNSGHSDNEKSNISEISFIPKKNVEHKKIIFYKNSENENQTGIDLGLDNSFIP